MIVTLPLIFIAVYVLFQIGLGAWLSRRVRTETDYFLGGRTLGIVVSTFSVFATWFGAESCIGTAGRVTEIGLAGARSDPLAYALCLFLMGALLAARLWQRQLTTLGDLFSERFGAGVMKLACVILVPTSILWAAAQIRAFGQMLAVASGQELSVTLYVATFAIIAYAMLGGFLADAWSDLIQGITIVVALVAIGALVVWKEDLGQVWSAIPAERLTLRQPHESWFAVADVWAVPLIGSVISQELIARVLAARSASISRRACLIAGSLYLLVGFIPAILGLVAPVVLPSIDDPEHAIPLLAERYLPRIGFMLFVGAVVSAILSTVDSALLAVSALVTHNLVLPRYPDLSDGWKVSIARGATVASGLIALALALDSGGIHELVEASSSLGSAGIFVLTLIAVFTPARSALAATACLVTGVVALPIAEHALHLEAPYLTTLLSALCAFVLCIVVERRLGRPVLDGDEVPAS